MSGLRFVEDADGAHLVMCGDEMIGQLNSPVVGGDGRRLWGIRVTDAGWAYSEAEAQAAAIAAFLAFLDRAGLQIKEAPRPDPLGEALNSGDGVYRP